MAVPSTKQWKDEVSQQFRFPGRVKVSMDIVSLVSKSSVVAVAQNYLPISNILETLDGENEVKETLATMEGYWKADGSMYLPSKVASENVDMPLMGLDNVQPMSMEYDFKQTTSFVGLTFSWDKEYESWATKLNVIGYGADGAEKYNYTVSPQPLTFAVADTPMDDVNKIKVTVLEWSNPALRPRLTEIYFGVIVQLTGKQIMKIAETTTQDFMCASLPQDTQKYTVRNQIYRVLDAGPATAESKNSHPLTDISRIFNKEPAAEGIAAVETYYWRADGSTYLPSKDVAENIDSPWMSNDANFSEDEPVEVVITYADPVQLNQINLTWNNITESWPALARVEGWDSYDNVVFSREIRASSPVTKIVGLYNTVKTVHIKIFKWNVPGQRARINQYEALLVYGNNNIPSEVNNLFDPTLKLGYSKYLARRQKVHVQYSLDTYNKGTLYLPEQIRFLDTWSIPTNAISADFQATTRLGLLTQVYNQGKYTPEGTSLYDLALQVLKNSNIIKDYQDPEPWVLTESLKNFKTTAPIPLIAVNSVLQLIAGAAGCYIDTRPTDGYVRISDIPDDTKYIISEKHQLQTPSVTLGAQLKSITVSLYNYTVGEEEQELFNGKVVLEGRKTIVVNYAEDACATECSATVSGATVISQTFYGYSATFELEVTDPAGEVTIVIKGKSVESSTVEVKTFEDPEVESGNEVAINNELITDMDTLKHVATLAETYYKKRHKSKAKYLGYPDLKAGDKLAFYSQYMNEFGRVTKHTFNYNGAFSGDVEILMEV